MKSERIARREFTWKKSPRKGIIVKRYVKGKILNVGCGNMYLGNAINFDINPDKFPDILSDFHSMPLKDKIFDVIFAFDVIKHSNSPEVLLRELERVCKDEGNIVIETADFDIIPKDWVADEDHKTYMNKEIFQELLGDEYSFFNIGEEMLLAVKKPRLLDKLLYQLLNLVVSTYKTITMQPRNRATHWR